MIVIKSRWQLLWYVLAGISKGKLMYVIPFFHIYILKEKAGVISPTPCWIATYDCYLHTNNTLMGLLWSLLTEYKHDRHLVGY